ncbi:hypothetical protein F441_00025 [Phytophthora nicotianae CJ01A1]|uniref:Uncharacterized protein n=3 Tax=Phytophthora nicotianae TaxID=4792 RepID=W2XZU2_PHYNI|nr:hypothetical protein L916_00022 [Phytophthora nicotianae]ETO59176.1 hypothetical protein F444_22449 [Phytophthora nicotianae P1976]ETP27469.1 hypothetical protein F441_00025 [Phytophthora nicotianae CJ01A1]
MICSEEGELHYPRDHERVRPAVPQPTSSRFHLN